MLAHIHTLSSICWAMKKGPTILAAKKMARNFERKSLQSRGHYIATIHYKKEKKKPIYRRPLPKENETGANHQWHTDGERNVMSFTNFRKKK